MIFSRELLFHSQAAILGASAITDEKIKRLEEEVHKLKLQGGEIMNIKNAMMQERDASQKHVYELQVELKGLKSDFVAFGDQFQLSESNCDAKECELVDIAERCLP